MGIVQKAEGQHSIECYHVRGPGGWHAASLNLQVLLGRRALPLSHSSLRFIEGDSSC